MKGWWLLLLSTSLQASLWQNTQQRGQVLFDRGDFVQAADVFDDNYRRGVAYFRAGDFNAAIEAFEMTQRSEVKDAALYNLANSYFQK